MRPILDRERHVWNAITHTLGQRTRKRIAARGENPNATALRIVLLPAIRHWFARTQHANPYGTCPLPK